MDKEKRELVKKMLEQAQAYSEAKWKETSYEEETAKVFKELSECPGDTLGEKVANFYRKNDFQRSVYPKKSLLLWK